MRAISLASGAMKRAPPGLSAMVLKPGQPMPAPHNAAAPKLELIHPGVLRYFREIGVVK